MVGEALHQRQLRVLPAAWELFGSLSDEQIGHFESARSVRVQIAEMTPPQRRALEQFFSVYRQTMKGVPITSEWSEDVVVELYRAGAREDLSNVDLIFDVRAGGAVRMVMYARKADGSYGPPAPLGLGRYYGKGEGR